MTRHGLVAGLLALALLGVLVTAVRAEKKELKASQSWNGSIDDEKLEKEAPPDGYVADAKALKKLWEAWKVGDKVPEIDFKKEILLVATGAGSKLLLNATLDTDSGDLRPVALGTKDLKPGFRYAIISVPREGVKTLGGKEIKSE
jgi:hypothetical protein